MTTEEAIRKFEIIRNTTEKVLASNSNPFVKECEQFYREQKQMAEMALSALRAKQEHTGPCDLCGYNPPSSSDGKPCTMCSAVSKQPEEDDATK